MMGIGRIVHTHKSFSYCWRERIIHKVRTVFKPTASIMFFTLISSLPIANTKRVTFSEEGCMSIELVWVLVRVLVWVSFSSSLYPISIYRFFSSFFYRATKYGKTSRGTTSVATSSGGGGTSNDMPWRDKDEDFLHFARRTMLYAHAMCYPGSRHKRTQSR